jgi:predicted ATPase/DNA-binding CsgD family transcriptional regulator
MLTLSGPGGIGKTRLALRALTMLATDFPHGVCFVEFADLSNPDLVVARVATAVGVAEEQSRPLLDTLADALRARRMLLALDNCEHLLDACARTCQRLLASSPELRLITTSRAPLRVAGETVWPVPPLTVAPAGAAPAGAEGALARSEATQLFTERAMAAAPGFALDARNAAIVEQLCRALDGIPLAIELAAARVRALSVEQILARMTDRFGLLTMGARTAPPRQQTLRAAIEWSHDLLTEPERVLLRRLSVFAGLSLEMAEQVCADERIPAAAVLDSLADLVDKSLVVREAEVLGQARYRLLDTIREYAADRLAAAGEGEAVKRRLREYLLAVAERNFKVGMALVPGPWQPKVDTLRRYEVEAGNLWQVLGDCLADGDVASGLRLCNAILPCMVLRGEFALGCEWVDAFLAAPGAPAVPAVIRGAAFIGRAQLTLSSDPASAETPARVGVELCRAADDPFWTACGLNALSEIAVHTGRPDEAGKLGRQAISIAEAAGDGWNEGWGLGIQAAAAGMQGRMREAAELASASISVMRRIDHRWGLARAQLGLGDLARLRGDHAGAHNQYTEALGCLRETGARPEIARCLSGLGRIAMDLGTTELAREHFTESLRLSHACGTRIGVARGLESFAALAVHQGEAEQGVLLAAAATALREAAGLPPLPGARAERYLGPARRLGDHVVARLWARGLALSADAAITLALEPRPVAPPDNVDVPAAGVMPASAMPTAGGVAAVAPPSSLTPREKEIATLIADGRSNKAIADELVISPATVARHVANIMAKLGFHSRAQIAALIADGRG